MFSEVVHTIVCVADPTVERGWVTRGKGQLVTAIGLFLCEEGRFERPRVVSLCSLLGDSKVFFARPNFGMSILRCVVVLYDATK